MLASERRPKAARRPSDKAVRCGEERSFLVPSCGPARAEARLALSALAGLPEPCSELLAVLPDPRPRALEVALLREDPGVTPRTAEAVAVG